MTKVFQEQVIMNMVNVLLSQRTKWFWINLDLKKKKKPFLCKCSQQNFPFPFSFALKKNLKKKSYHQGTNQKFQNDIQLLRCPFGECLWFAFGGLKLTITDKYSSNFKKEFSGNYMRLS